MYHKPELKIIGENGNAFNILSKAQRSLREAGRMDDWEKIRDEAMSGDYDHLLQTMDKHFEVC